MTNHLIDVHVHVGLHVCMCMVWAYRYMSAGLQVDRDTEPTGICPHRTPWPCIQVEGIYPPPLELEKQKRSSLRKLGHDTVISNVCMGHLSYHSAWILQKSILATSDSNYVQHDNMNCGCTVASHDQTLIYCRQS